MPPGPNPFQQVGARPSRDSQGAPLFYNRFIAGLVTQRNPLRDPSGVVQERWYGGKGDALLDGLNLELSNRLSLVRAPGSTAYSTATFPQQPSSFFPFKQFTAGSQINTLIVDTPSTIYTLNPTTKATILTKANGAGPAFFIGINNILYIGDGVEQKAWTPIGGVRNWGIAIGGFGGSSTAYAGTGADTNIGGIAWSTPGNIAGAPGGSFATVTLMPGQSSDALDATNFGFSAGGIVAGITVRFFGFFTTTPSPGITLTVQLILNGAPIGNPKTVVLAANNIQYALGGGSDTWGAGLSAAQVNGSGFGVRFTWSYSGSLISQGVQLEGGQISVATQGPPASSLVAGSSAAPTVGWQYVAAYGNGNSGTLSTATQPTGVLKPSASQAVQLSLVASTDTQVNQIWVFRTKDGGTTWGNLPTSPYANITANITDGAADSTLNMLQQGDTSPTGPLNIPPPSGLIGMEYHMGRLWGFVGNVVRYAAGGPDLGLIVGNGAEAWPAANAFTFPSQVTRLVSVTISTNLSMLLVFTVDDVYPIYGNASAIGVASGAPNLIQFYIGSKLLARTGLASYYALDIRGSQIYMMTKDGRLVSFNPASQVVFLDPEKALTEIGFAIGAAPPGVTLSGGTLTSFNPSSTFVSWHGSGSADQALYVADGSTGWFRCNPNQQPDGGPVWSPKRNIVGGAGPVQSIETSPGVFQLLIGQSNGTVLFRDPTVNKDNGTAYGSGNCFARIGAIVLAHHGQVATPEFIGADFVNVGSQPTVKVLLDELDGTFTTLSKTDNDPPHLAAPATVLVNRYALRQATSGTQPPNACRWMQMIVDFGNDTVLNELLAYSIFGSYEQES